MKPFHTPSLCFSVLNYLETVPERSAGYLCYCSIQSSCLAGWRDKEKNLSNLGVLCPRSVEITIATWVPIPMTLTCCKLGDTPILSLELKTLYRITDAQNPILSSLWWLSTNVIPIQEFLLCLLLLKI